MPFSSYLLGHFMQGKEDGARVENLGWMSGVRSPFPKETLRPQCQLGRLLGRCIAQDGAKPSLGERNGWISSFAQCSSHGRLYCRLMRSPEKPIERNVLGILGPCPNYRKQWHGRLQGDRHSRKRAQMRVEVRRIRERWTTCWR